MLSVILHRYQICCRSVVSQFEICTVVLAVSGCGDRFAKPDWRFPASGVECLGMSQGK